MPISLESLNSFRKLATPTDPGRTTPYTHCLLTGPTLDTQSAENPVSSKGDTFVTSIPPAASAQAPTETPQDPLSEHTSQPLPELDPQATPVPEPNSQQTLQSDSANSQQSNALNSFFTPKRISTELLNPEAKAVKICPECKTKLKQGTIECPECKFRVTFISVTSVPELSETDRILCSICGVPRGNHSKSALEGCDKLHNDLRLSEAKLDTDNEWPQILTTFDELMLREFVRRENATLSDEQLKIKIAVYAKRGVLVRIVESETRSNAAKRKIIEADESVGNSVIHLGEGKETKTREPKARLSKAEKMQAKFKALGIDPAKLAELLKD